MRVVSVIREPERQFATVRFEQNGREVVKIARLHSVQKKCARSATEREQMLTGELVMKAVEAYRDFMVYEARDAHGDDWRAHCNLKNVPPMNELFTAVA